MAEEGFGGFLDRSVRTELQHGVNQSVPIWLGQFVNGGDSVAAQSGEKPLYLRKLPKGSFTVTVSITLKKGKGLTERRRYTACK